MAMAVIRSSELDDNCIQNFHLGRYIVGFMVGNFVLRQNKTDDIPLQMKILNMVIPILMHFLTFIRQKHFFYQM